MPVRSKPVRIFEADDSALTLLSGLLRRSRAEVVHAALVEYLANHRAHLAGLFEDTQAALAKGDLDALARIASDALESDADRLAAELPK